MASTSPAPPLSPGIVSPPVGSRARGGVGTLGQGVPLPLRESPVIELLFYPIHLKRRRLAEGKDPM